MSIIPFKLKDDYPVILKEVDGEMIEFVCLDTLTEEQFKKYCRDSGTEYFRRFNITI